MDIVKQLEAELVERKDWPEFQAGDTIAVTYSIKEGDKQRSQTFTGTVIQRRGTGATETFTIRKVSNNIGVERVFPFTSPFIEEIKILKTGSVRRSRIFYLRKRQGKSARIKERKFLGGREEDIKQRVAATQAPAEAKSDSAKASADKPEVKKEEAPAPKAEAKTEAPKKEAAPKKEEAKKEEPKKADKEEKKAEQPKAEAKKEEPKKGEPKAEAKKEEDKKEDKAEAKSDEDNK